MNKKNWHLLIIFVFYLILLNSCFIDAGVNIHRDFSYYKQKPFLCDTPEVKLNGIFYSINSIPLKTIYFYQDTILNIYSYLFLYDNGIIQFDNYCEWNSCLEFIKTYEQNYKNDIINKKDSWGHYIVRNDTLYFQYFKRFYQVWMKRNSINVVGKIIDDSTIALTHSFYKWSNMTKLFTESKLDKIYKPPIILKFHPSEFKPDSTDAWFSKKRWYKKSKWNKNNN